jgi:hypothetical protein
MMKVNYETWTESRNCARVSAQVPKADGTAPDSELTPQALAEIGEERFAEKQARGDKTKLMQLFGH